MDMTGFVVAIDGPGGSGKTSVARAVAMALELPHLDTGAYYRAATVAVLRAGVEPTDEPSVVSVVARASLGYDRGRMTLDGDDVSAEIRAGTTTSSVSAVSAIPAVRSHLVDAQRQWVGDRGGSAVVEGRDIGTVVFPHANLKLFLTARPEVRAARRAAEVGIDAVEAVESDLLRRDRLDTGRESSPLKKADDAVEIDTSELGIDEVIARILVEVEARR